MKKLYRVWLALALLICATLAATAAIPETLAYMQQESNTVQNKINVVYVPPEDTVVPVAVHKTIVSLGEETIAPAGFRFALRCLESGETLFLTTDETGYASVELPFTEEDVGNIYTYELTELDGGNERITYSEQLYTIRIALTVDAANQVSADVTVNDIHVQRVVAEFQNVYTPIVLPDTGDAAQPLLYAALVLLSGAGLFLHLRRRNRTIN